MNKETVNSLQKQGSCSEVHDEKKLAAARIRHRKNTMICHLEEVLQIGMFSSSLMKERSFQVSQIPLTTKKSKEYKKKKMDSI